MTHDLQRSPASPGHPADEELRRFMMGELGRLEIRAIVRHLLTGCPSCHQWTRQLWNKTRETETRKRSELRIVRL
jgi:hypothetical protein